LGSLGITGMVLLFYQGFYYVTYSQSDKAE